MRGRWDGFGWVGGECKGSNLYSPHNMSEREKISNLHSLKDTNESSDYCQPCSVSVTKDRFCVKFC